MNDFILTVLFNFLLKSCIFTRCFPLLFSATGCIKGKNLFLGVHSAKIILLHTFQILFLKKNVFVFIGSKPLIINDIDNNT